MHKFEESVNEYWNPFHNWSDDQTQHQHHAMVASRRATRSIKQDDKKLEDR
jgi:hypothetical protein